MHQNSVQVSDCSAGVPPAVAGASRPRPPFWASLVATLFGVGRLKPGPGTWGSVATVVIWALVSWRIPPEARTWATITAVIVVTIVGIPAATRVVRASGLKDPQFVVIDEVAGQLVALIAVPLAWKTFLAGLILFRVFDILKPPPVRQLERLPEGRRRCVNWSVCRRAWESWWTILGLGSTLSSSCICCCTFDF